MPAALKIEKEIPDASEEAITPVYKPLEDDQEEHMDSDGIWLLSYADLMTLLMGFFALMTSMSTFDEENFAEVGSGAAAYFGGATEDKFKELGEELKGLIEKRGLKDKVQIVSKKTEIKITFQGTLFFNSGSVSLKDTANVLMTEIIEILNKEAANEKFLVEGHTDNIPMDRGLIASNWELSALRASAVARLFEKNGFQRKQIMTIGWAETRPLADNSDKAGRPISVNQAKNRRVVLKVLRQHPL